MTEIEDAQRILCDRYGSPFAPISEDDIVGRSRNFASGTAPLHGLRHPPSDTTSGWYLWCGDYSEEDDFFEPVHAKHLREPHIVKFLALAPGWRFLCDGTCEDVWFDPALLDLTGGNRSGKKWLLG